MGRGTSTRGAVLAVIDAGNEPWDAIVKTAKLRAIAPNLPLLVLGPDLAQPGFLKAALDSGATRVLSRPFDAARLGVALGGSVGPFSPSSRERGGFVRLSEACGIDLAGRCLRIGTCELPLTKGKFDLLEYLVRHPGRAVSADELVRGGVLAPSQRSRYRAIVLELRDKLGDARDCIRTVPGYGYRFDPPLHVRAIETNTSIELSVSEAS
jgi:DNA-binding response OmpR family regulator